jgi:hypothetical protein
MTRGKKLLDITVNRRAFILNPFVNLCAICLTALLVMTFGFEALDGVHAQSSCTNPPSSSSGEYVAANTQLTIYIDPSFLQQEITGIKAAISNWSGQTALTSNNITMTITTTDPGADSQNSVRILNSAAGSPKSVAYTQTNQVATPSGVSTGQVHNFTISFNRGFMYDNNTPAYDPQASNAQSFITKVFDHEFGHGFGLTDITPPNDPSTGKPDPCLETPGASVMNGDCGTNDASGMEPNSVTSCDNAIVNLATQTDGGRLVSSGSCVRQSCPSGYYWNADQCSCQSNGQLPPPISPIVIDTEGEGFHLTSAVDGVRFDIRGDGNPIQIAWTDPHFHNAFLALDRDGDGKIDSGKELFGNFTQQPKSENPNGFLALAEFDKPENGGNGDGVIDEHDAVFSRLRLWIDDNHDGISQPGELHALSEFGIHSLSLNYFESRRKDAFGNQFRYRAFVNPGEHRDFRDLREHGDAGEVGRWAYDVFFVTVSK